jgi:hypothetical protein
VYNTYKGFEDRLKKFENLYKVVGLEECTRLAVALDED